MARRAVAALVTCAVCLAVGPAPVAARPAEATLAITVAKDPTDFRPITFTAVEVSPPTQYAPYDLSLDVRTAGSKPCAATAGEDYGRMTGGQGYLAWHAQPGTHTYTTSVGFEAGRYIGCAYLTESYTDTTLATVQTSFTVRRARAALRLVVPPQPRRFTPATYRVKLTAERPGTLTVAFQRPGVTRCADSGDDNLGRLEQEPLENGAEPRRPFDELAVRPGTHTYAGRGWSEFSGRILVCAWLQGDRASSLNTLAQARVWIVVRR